MPTQAETESAQQIEVETQRIGRELWDHLARRRPSVFERPWAPLPLTRGRSYANQLKTLTAEPRWTAHP